MSKARLLLENIVVYGFGGVIGKVIPLIMMPVITRMMPDSTYFGISDLSSMIASFGSALAIMGMYDAMFRMYFEKDDEMYKKKICSTTLAFTFFTSVVVFLLMLLSRRVLAEKVYRNGLLANIVLLPALHTLTGATNTIVAAPTRMQNRRRVFLITNAVAPLLSYSIAIYLLLNKHYLIALPLSGLMSAMMMEAVFFLLNRSWFHIGMIDRSLIRPMLAIGLPLLPGFIGYWLFDSCDKLMIANILGVAEEGVYAVGAKLGHISQLIYVAFAGGWQFFAFSTMKEENQIESNSRIFEYLGVISFVATAFVCTFARPFYRIIFPLTYENAFIVSPYLFLSPLLLLLFQIAGNQFLIIKKTWPVPFLLFGGVTANIILNLELIPRFGIEGAAVATLAGYMVSVCAGVFVLCRLGQMIIPMRFIASIFGAVIFFVLWRLLLIETVIRAVICAVVFAVFCLYLYREPLQMLYRVLRSHR